MKSLILAVLAALWPLGGGRLEAAPAGGPAAVHPMVPLFHRWDHEKAAGRIAAVAQTGARRVSFTVLLLAELEPGFRIRHFGAVWPLPQLKADGTADSGFRALSAAMRQEIRGSLTAAFADAARRGLEINVLPQIDASGSLMEWRNFFDFDPAERYGEFSYETAVLGTVLEALEAAVPAGHPVEMTLEGEMGCSLFTWPDQWRGVMERLRARGKLTHLRVGISANYDGVAGRVKPSAAQQAGMQRLIAASDFVGLSCYARTGNPPTVADFTACVDRFCAEFAEAGCPIPLSKPLRFTELGHGGGGLDAEGKQTVPGPDVARMGKSAFFGTDLLGKNPWTTPERIAYRQAFYRSALEFLRTQPARWRVEQAYLWGFGSWDPYGITETAFGDPDIVKIIQQHNAAVLKDSEK